MKENISAKNIRRCGRKISKLFYKFLVSLDPIKFTDMELVNDEDVKTMIALYCWNLSCQTDLIHLFAELADMELAEDFTPLSEEHEVQDPCANDDGNVNTSLVGNPNRDIVIRNDPRAHMSNIDLDATHASEFPEYPDILTTHWLAADSGCEEVFMGQKFATNKECVFAIKRYIMNLSVDYKSLCLNRHCILRSVRGQQKVATGGYEPHLSRSRKCGRFKNLLSFTHALQHV
ncbi:hypothetical protein GOBAR_DD07041 [Gossypium barbadense]|nr:hypothetical protein GOBAR_DD07041 [Gossypium barbadense]